jgi:hypothetical protein
MQPDTPVMYVRFTIKMMGEATAVMVDEECLGSLAAYAIMRRWFEMLKTARHRPRSRPTSCSDGSRP